MTRFNNDSVNEKPTRGTLARSLLVAARVAAEHVAEMAGYFEREQREQCRRVRSRRSFRP